MEVAMTKSGIGRGFEEAQSAYLAETTSDFVGQVRRFGAQGPAYEVMDMRQNGELAIQVVQSGERLDYPLSDFVADPVAVTVP
jgi:hypothetical protein